MTTPNAPGRPIPLAIVADDFGLTDASSDAILEAHLHGVVTATSVLAVVPGVEQRLRRLDHAPDLEVGVHLALVGEDRPVLSAAEIPSLVDAHGAFAASWRHLLPRLAAGRVDAGDVRRELTAQVEVVRAHRSVDHLDGHQHLQLWPSVAEVVVDLAVAVGARAVRVPRPSAGGAKAAAMGALSARLAGRVRSAGLTCSDRFRGVEEAGHWDLGGLRAALLDLAQAEGSVEINTHPGAALDPDRSRYRWGYGWAEELAALRSPELRWDLDRLGFALVGPRDL